MTRYYTDPTTGQRVEIRRTHRFRNFVVFPVLGLVALGVVIAAVNGAPAPPSTHSGSGSVAAVDASTGDSDEAVDLAFGQTHTWSGGEAITVSVPAAFDTGNPYLTAPQGKRLVSVDVTVRNGSDRQYNAMQTMLTAQHNGRVAQQSFLGGEVLPNTELAPGGEVTFSQVYEIDENPGELRLSVKPTMFADNTVYFVGQV